MNAQRSGIPKVVGILMIVFASLGLIASLWGLAVSAASDAMLREIPQLKTWSKIDMVYSVVGLGISGLHLAAGISAVKYKASAPKLAVTYGAIVIVAYVVRAILLFAWLKPAIAKAQVPGAADALGGFIVIATIFIIIWPTIVLALMTRPAAKEACVN